LVTLNRLPGIAVPTLTDQLSAVSQRAQEAQAAVQDFRTTLADLKAGVVTNVVEAITTRTAKIDAALARIQAIVNKYQAAVTRAQERVTSTSNNILLLIDLSAVSLTILLLIFAVGMVLLIYVCWQYVRTGRFPSLRVG
jgi:membrane-associated HD superfamily phosphohydrolase